MLLLDRVAAPAKIAEPEKTKQNVCNWNEHKLGTLICLDKCF